jgi:putative DNA primase/helicase
MDEAAFGDAVAFLSSFFPQDAPWPLVAIKPRPGDKAAPLDAVGDSPALIRAYTVRPWAEGISSGSRLRPWTENGPLPLADRIQKQVAAASEWIARHDRQGFNLYYAVNPHKKIIQRKARKDDVLAARFLFADIDPPKDATPAEIETWRAGMLQKLAGPLPGGLPVPTWVIDSGRGFWSVWQLVEPIPLDGGGPLTTDVEARGIGIEQTLASLGADCTHNVDRIARLPGTVNRKTNKRSRVISHHPEALYSLEDFPRADITHDVEPPAEAPRPNGPISEHRAELPADLMQIICEGVPGGERSEAFHHAVGQLRDLGWSVQQVVELFGEYPEGIAAKYRKRLVKEVRRSFGKSDNSGTGHDERGSESFELNIADLVSKPAADVTSAVPRKESAPDSVAPLVYPSPRTPSWPEPQPLPDGLSPVAAFDLEFLPASVGPWIADISERMQCPPDYVGIAAMAALGAVLGARIGIRPQAYTDWTEVANLWACIIGPPGAMKSPAMEEALGPLYRLEALAIEANADALRRYTVEAEAFKIDKDNVLKRAKGTKSKKDGESDTAAKARETVIEALAKLGEKPAEPKPRCYFTNDSTYQALTVQLCQNPYGLLVYCDELVALWQTLDQPEYTKARGFYKEAWGGKKPFSGYTISRGNTRIGRTCLSVLGGTQPDLLSTYIRPVNFGGALNDGLMQRHGLLIWPDQAPDWREVDRPPNAGARELAWQTFEHFDMIAPEDVGAESDPYSDRKVPFLRFDAEALALFQSWHAELEHRLRSGELGSALTSHFSKYRKLVPSLALLNHLADGGTGRIGARAVRRAIAFAAYLETHARRAYGAGDLIEGDAAHGIIAKMRVGEQAGGLPASFTAREVYRHHWAGLSDHEVVSAGLNLLVELDWLSITLQRSSGRTKTVYHVNPRGLL